MRKFLCLLSVINILIFNTSVYAEPESEIAAETETLPKENDQNPIPEITAEGAVVIDPATGIMLYQKNADKILYPASITKIMTSLLVMEYAESDGHSYDEIVTHSHNAVYNIGLGSSHIDMLVRIIDLSFRFFRNSRHIV